LDSLIYFLWISLTVSGLIVLSVKRAQKFDFPMDLNFKVTGWLLITIPVGARILHIFYEEPNYYLENPLRIFEFWKGGFVYYGGLIFSFMAVPALFYFQKQKKSFLETADFLTPLFCLGTGFGRVACYLQGCCFGSPWPLAIFNGRPQPTQLYILLWEILLFFFIRRWELKKNHPPGQIFLSWMILSAFGRFMIEFLRADFRGAKILGLSVSQVIAFFIVLICCLSLSRLALKMKHSK